MSAARGGLTRVAVLVSGNGTNLQAIMDHLAAGALPAEICGVFSDRAGIFGLERARRAGIPAHAVPYADFPTRSAAEAELGARLAELAPDLVVLAGFMRILTPAFVTHYSGRLLNIHPSLLPKHKGLHTHQRALEAGDSEHGCSVHFVTEELDGGPLVVQAVLPVLADDTPDSLAQRVHQAEHQIYPLAVRWFAEGRLRLGPQGCLLDGQALPAQGWQIRP